MIRYPRFRFVSGFLIASLIFAVGAVAVNVNNTPQGGYLLCANTKTKAVTFPGTLKCPSGTKEIIIPGTGAVINDNSGDTQTDEPAQSTNTGGKGSPNCNLTYLQNNPSQVATVVPQCSSSQLSALQKDLNNFESAAQSKIDTEQKRLQDLQKEAASKKGTDAANAAAEAVDKQSALVADLIAKTKSNIGILTAIVQAIAKKVKG